MSKPIVLGIVGMRSGSTGVPDKNIRSVGGRPLFTWILRAATSAKLVNRVVISTDSERYAGLARDHGAEIPTLRPVSIAGPQSTDIEFIVHMLDWLDANEGYVPDIVVRLLATTPLQRPEDIDGVVAALHEAPEADSAMVVAEARQHPMKAMRLVPDAGGSWLKPYVEDAGLEPRARQRHDPAYFRANVVASRTATIRETGTLTGTRVACHVVPQDRSIDIDSEFDLEVADLLLRRGQSAAT